MSFQVMTWARGIKTGSITVKAVLMAVANYADENGVSWPSQEQLAEDVEASRHTVLRALDVLAERGVLKKERRHRQDGSRSSDRIILDLSYVAQSNVAQSNVAGNNVATDPGPMLQAATAEPVIEPPLSSLRSDRTRAKPTPRSELERVLDPEHVDAVIEYRKAKKTAFTAHMAKLLADQLGKWPDPNEAADEMMAAHWTGFKPAWLERRLAERGGPGPPGSGKKTAWERQAEAWEEIRNERQQQRPDESLAGPVLSLPRTGTDGQ